MPYTIYKLMQMTFDDQLKALVLFHLEDYTSAQHLLQVLEEDDFARRFIAPEEGTKKICIEAKAINPESNVFYDAIVLLGTPGVNQTKKSA